MATASWSGNGFKYVFTYTVTTTNSNVTVKMDSIKVTEADATPEYATIGIGTWESLQDGSYWWNQPYSGKKCNSSKTGVTTNLGASYTYPRKTFAYNITISIIANADKNISIAIPVLASYSVIYNANGGTGAPTSQTKYYGIDLPLRTAKPTKDGYAFKCWNTDASGNGTNYNAGANYAENAAVTLYAIWEPRNVVNVYDASGNVHKGIVTAYNASGAARQCIINVYDANGYKRQTN
jgi:uncharacterized repeat protein (TIGR02543 family)